MATIETRTPAASAPPLVSFEFVLDLRTRAARVPALPIRPLTGREVAVAVRYAADEGQELPIDLSAMKRIVIDPRGRTARVQPGVTPEELRQAAFHWGLAPVPASLVAAQVVTPEGELVDADEELLGEVRSGAVQGIVVDATYRLQLLR